MLLLFLRSSRIQYIRVRIRERKSSPAERAPTASPDAPRSPPPETGPAAHRLGYGRRYELATPQACPGSTSGPPTPHTAASSRWRSVGLLGTVDVVPARTVRLRDTSRHSRVKSELADTNASNQRAMSPGGLVWVWVRTPWARSCPFRHSTDHYHYHGAVTSLTRDLVEIISRDLFNLRAGRQYHNSTTRFINVPGRVHGCAGRPPTGAPGEAQKGPTGTG